MIKENAHEEYDPKRDRVIIKLPDVRKSLGVSLIQLNSDAIDYTRGSLYEGTIVAFGPDVFKDEGYASAEEAGFKIGDYVGFRKSFGQWYPPLKGEDWENSSGYRIVQSQHLDIVIKRAVDNG